MSDIKVYYNKKYDHIQLNCPNVQQFLILSSGHLLSLCFIVLIVIIDCLAKNFIEKRNISFSIGKINEMFVKID